MKCKHLTLRTKKGTKYYYCKFYKKEVSFTCYKECDNKEYKQYKTISKRSKATDIPQKVKQVVWERDNHCCVICGNNYNVMPNAHYIPRSKGGLGIEQNIFTACTRLTENDCHYKFDNYGIGKEKVKEHLSSIYPNWDEQDLYYRK